MNYDFVFVVLVYKNSDDLRKFIKNIDSKFTNYKIIVINAHYSDDIDNKVKIIAEKNNCDFINIENKGYGYGNNVGIEYAEKKYKYQYIIIANPDTIVKSIDVNLIKKIKYGIIAPDIRTKKGKIQNPYWAIENRFAEWLIYVGYKYNKKIIRYFAYAINKIIRNLYYILEKTSKSEYGKIYAAHGSFFILSKSAIHKIGKLFDENMFLFSEEAYVAYQAKKKEIPILYTNRIKVCHMEDGSINKSNIKEDDISRNSFIYYYEKMIKEDKDK